MQYIRRTKYLLIDFVFLVKPPVNSRLLAIKLLGSHNFTWIFNCGGGCITAPNPHVVQRSAVHIHVVFIHLSVDRHAVSVSWLLGVMIQ